MVLLDMMVRSGGHDLVVAHFDHGIRPDSHEDAAFVQEVATRYGLIFESSREELGPQAGESLARNRRYRFLRAVAEKYDARIVTAHHLDDLVETIAVNLTRGTGWRGLAVFNSPVARPLIDMQKSDLIAYAKNHGIKWREDPTNESDAYLRNRLRRQAAMLTLDQKRQLRALHVAQLSIRGVIEDELQVLAPLTDWYSRYFYTMLPQPVAMECLYWATSGRLTRPQLARLLLAIKTSPANTTYQAGNGIAANFTTRQFSL